MSSARRSAGLTLLLLASCAVAPSRIQLPAGQPLPPGEALVFGRVEIWQGDGQVVGERGTTEPAQGWGAFYLAVCDGDRGEVIAHPVRDGAIRWHLPPGRYALCGFAHAGRHSTVAGRVGATFEVTAGAPAVYVGTLAFSFPGPSLDVTDELVAELRAARPALPPGASATRSLLRLPGEHEPAREELHGPPLSPVSMIASAVHAKRRLTAGGEGVHDRSLTGSREDEPPAVPDDPATEKDREWTTIRVTGARPVRPGAWWKVLDSRQPTLEWEPPPGVDAAGLTYDLRISRMVPIGDAWTRTIFTWGPVAYLRSALAEPRHRVETPLDPGTDYYWEVRLRRGERVGPWSRFEVPMQKWNVPFSFRTPEAR